MSFGDTLFFPEAVYYILRYFMSFVDILFFPETLFYVLRHFILPGDSLVFLQHFLFYLFMGIKKQTTQINRYDHKNLITIKLKDLHKDEFSPGRSCLILDEMCLKCWTPLDTLHEVAGFLLCEDHALSSL